jgi:hypothetical protein
MQLFGYQIPPVSTLGMSSDSSSQVPATSFTSRTYEDQLSRYTSLCDDLTESTTILWETLRASAGGSQERSKTLQDLRQEVRMRREAFRCLYDFREKHVDDEEARIASMRHFEHLCKWAEEKSVLSKLSESIQCRIRELRIACKSPTSTLEPHLFPDILLILKYLNGRWHADLLNKLTEEEEGSTPASSSCQSGTTSVADQGHTGKKKKRGQAKDRQVVWDDGTKRYRRV